MPQELTKISQIKTALKWNEAIYERIKDTIKAGMSEKEILQIVDDTYAQCAGRRISFSYDLISGPRAGEMEGAATERTLQKGDTLILDIQASCNGIYCDTTRTFFLGSPDREMRSAYNAVLRALREGESVLKPGTSAHRIYQVISGALTDSGFPELPHHAGHGIGQRALLQPQFLSDRMEVLEEGMLITLEPGVYFPNEGGVRVENNYYITAQGYLKLFDYPEEADYFIC